MNPLLYKIQDVLLTGFIIFSYASLVLYALGRPLLSPHTMQLINEYVQVYLVIFLLLRFHPFRHHLRVPFTELDRKVVFSAALFLLSTSILNRYVSNLKNAVTRTYAQDSPGKTVHANNTNG